jgi:dTDP-4-amino-4,6-dideoxygalactose transaminase
VKLARLDADNNRRREIASYYMSISNPEITLPLAGNEKASNRNDHVWHLFVIRFKQRDALSHYLSEQGIQTLIHYPVPPHLQGAFAEWRDMEYPKTEDIHNTVLSLPISPVLNEGEIKQVVEVINRFEL